MRVKFKFFFQHFYNKTDKLIFLNICTFNKVLRKFNKLKLKYYILQYLKLNFKNKNLIINLDHKSTKILDTE